MSTLKSVSKCKSRESIQQAHSSELFTTDCSGDSQLLTKHYSVVKYSEVPVIIDFAEEESREFASSLKQVSIDIYYFLYTKIL